MSTLDWRLTCVVRSGLHVQYDVHHCMCNDCLCTGETVKQGVHPTSLGTLMTELPASSQGGECGGAKVGMSNPVP